ncbi:MAG: nucleoside phosphorylase, partial [Ignisphaera sp.]
MLNLIGPIHIKAKRGDVAERVIVAGDPARVEQLIKMIENPRLVNTNRGFTVYTGAYKGVPVSI